MSSKIEGKVALVTGALGGIGKEFVKALLRNNIKGIALLDLNPTAAELFQKELEKTFDAKKTIFLATDVSSTEQLKVAFEETISHFGHVDIVVNNAGIACEDNFEKCMNLNVMGVMRSVYLAMETYLPKYKCGKDAYIINIASILGLTPITSVAAYSTSKYAVMGMSMTYGTNFYYEKYGVNLLTICPGFTDTPLLDNVTTVEFDDESLRDFCVNSIQKPETVGEAIVTALQDGENGSVWLTHQNKPAEKINMKEVLGSLRKKTGMIVN